MKKIGMISLGCDKNTVDTEKILGRLNSCGYQIVNDPAEADIIIINTCAFIESAKAESIDTIIEMARYKADNLKKIVVAGCLANRYYDQLKAELTEADIIIKTRDYDRIVELLEDNDNKAKCSDNTRIITTPYHYAYLKISEGCDNKCTYCAIPGIRGSYRSDRIENLTDEAKRLIDTYNIKELILVAQDVTRYGVDIYHKYALLDLLDELEKLEIEWIRLMYCYPELVSDELIDRVASGGKVVRYLDIPLQHISNGILKRMNRRNTKEDAYKLLDRIRKKDENISIRSTFITGFPGETEDEFNELLDFVRYAELDNAGFFAYSREDNTPAYKMKEQLAKRTKQSRTDRLYAAQTETLLNKYKGYIGREFTVMYEGIDYNRQCFYGRSYMSAPGIDSRILFKGSNLKAPGEFINTRITGNNELDLVAEIIED